MKTIPVTKLNVPEGLGALKTHLLIDLRAVIIAFLASARYSVSHTGRMPSSDARHFPQPFVGLSGKLLRVPAACHTCPSTDSGSVYVQCRIFKRAAWLRPLKPRPLETPMMSIISSW